MSSQLLLENGVNIFGSDNFAAGTHAYKNTLKAPIRYMEAIDASVTINHVKYELDGADADDSLSWIENALPLTPAKGIVAFPREVMEFTCDGEVKVYYASKPRTQLELVDDYRELIGNDSLEVIHF